MLATIILASGLTVHAGVPASTPSECAQFVLEIFEDMGLDTPRSISCQEGEEEPEPPPDGGQSVLPPNSEPRNWEDPPDGRLSSEGQGI